MKQTILPSLQCTRWVLTSLRIPGQQRTFKGALYAETVCKFKEMVTPQGWTNFGPITAEDSEKDSLWDDVIFKNYNPHFYSMWQSYSHMPCYSTANSSLWESKGRFMNMSIMYWYCRQNNMMATFCTLQLAMKFQIGMFSDKSKLVKDCEAIIHQWAMSHVCLQDLHTLCRMLVVCVFGWLNARSLHSPLPLHLLQIL